MRCGKNYIGGKILEIINRYFFDNEVVFFCVLFFLSILGFAAPPPQNHIVFEYGLQGGIAHYFGDLNTRLQFKRPSYLAGIWGRASINDYIALRLSLAHAHVSYDDKLNEGAPFMLARNLNFASDIWEMSLQGDFNFYAFIPKHNRYFFTTYVTLGLGLLYFDPYTMYAGEKQLLRYLGTEGQDVSSQSAYEPWSLVFPVGVGVKYNIGKHVNIGLEIGYRFAMTDYLDDVSTTYAGIDHFAVGTLSSILQDRSTENGGVPIGYAGKQRGNAEQSDGYMFFSFFISFNIVRKEECPDNNALTYQYKRRRPYKRYGGRH